MVSILTELTKQPFLAELPAKHIERVAEFATEVTYAKDEYLLHEGREANHFYIILEGEVGIQTYIQGRGFTDIQAVRANEVLGWSWLIPPHYWHFSGQASTPVRAIQLDGKRLREACDKDREFGYELLKRFVVVIGQRLAGTRKQLSEEI